jgi:hypothetical protein
MSGHIAICEFRTKACVLPSAGSLQQQQQGNITIFSLAGISHPWGSAQRPASFLLRACCNDSSESTAFSSHGRIRCTMYKTGHTQHNQRIDVGSLNEAKVKYHRDNEGDCGHRSSRADIKGPAKALQASISIRSLSNAIPQKPKDRRINNPKLHNEFRSTPTPCPPSKASPSPSRPLSHSHKPSIYESSSRPVPTAQSAP